MIILNEEKTLSKILNLHIFAVTNSINTVDIT